MLSAILTACVLAQIPYTLDVKTTSSYGNGTITWDASSSQWTGTLSRPFRYEAYPDGIPRVCGTASGTAKVAVAMDMTGLLTLSWDSTHSNVCAVDGGGGTGGAYRNTRVYAVTSQAPFKAAVVYNAFSDTIPPFWGFATLTVSAP